MHSFKHDGFITTGKRPLAQDSFCMNLYQKAKKLGIWNPAEIDLSVDKKSWQNWSEEERDLILGQVSVFQGGEESVTLDLLPLIMTVAREGRLEEELYLTTFLFEEGKHTEFFSIWLREVAESDGSGLDVYHTPSYKKIFYEELPKALWALNEDQSPKAQLNAALTYNMVVEGILAETGYYTFYEAGNASDVFKMPGLLFGINKIQQDESRHIAYGLYLISRLLSVHPYLWDFLQERMAELLALAVSFLNERINYHLENHGRLAFGIKEEEVISYAMGQYQKRMVRLEKARHKPLEELEFLMTGDS